MEKDGNTVLMTVGEFADLIQSYDEQIELEKDNDRSVLVAKLKALLFDLRKEIVAALRLIDAEEEVEVP